MNNWTLYENVCECGIIADLASDVFLGEFILSLVAQDDVDLLCSWPTDVRTYTNTHTHTGSIST